MIIPRNAYILKSLRCMTMSSISNKYRIMDSIFDFILWGHLPKKGDRITLKEQKIFLERPKIPKNPLTLEQLREMDGQRVLIKIINPVVSTDDFDCWGICHNSWVKVCDANRDDLICVIYDFEDYGQLWLAYCFPVGGKSKLHTAP